MQVAPLVKLKATGKTVSPPTYRRSATPLQPALYSHPFTASPLQPALYSHPFTPLYAGVQSRTFQYVGLYRQFPEGNQLIVTKPVFD